MRFVPALMFGLVSGTFITAPLQAQESSNMTSNDSSANSSQNSSDGSSRGPSDPPPPDDGGGGGATSDSNSFQESSQATTEDSNESTRQSTRNTTERSQQETRDSSRSQTNGVKLNGTTAALIVGAAVVVAGAGVLYTYRDRISAEPVAAETRLSEQLREYHSLVVNDVASAGGPLVDAWLHQMNLSDDEREQFYARFRSSSERLRMLDVIDGEITPQRAQDFSVAFVRVLASSWGEARSERLLNDLSCCH